MKMYLFSVLALFVLIELTHGDEFKKEFPLKMGKEVSVNLRSGGALELRGWSEERVELNIEYRGIDHIEEMIDISNSSSGIDIECYTESSRNTRLKVFLMIPEKSNIDVETMGGEIKLENIEGILSAKTMGGSLNLSDLTGEVSMTTMGGNINVQNSMLDGKVKTMGGNIYFDNVSGRVDGETMGGNVTYKNVYDKDGKPRVDGKPVKISTMGGNIDLREAPQGADLHTMGGNISVERARNFIKAHTMGGDIEIQEIDGWTKASTMGGNVTVNMTGDASQGKRDVDLSSLGGTIVLTLPKDISCTFDIRQTVTKGNNDKYEIKSDFDLEIDLSKDWNYSRGSARKINKASGKVGDGRNRVKIETTNGDIIIHKQ